MEVEEKTEFKFAELDDRAKERARDNWREHHLDYDWYDHIYSDAVTIGALMGIEIGENVSRTVGGKHVSSPDISFSGFWSQGDGCCFSGALRVSKLQGAVKRMKDHVGGDDNELHALAARAEAAYAQINARIVLLRMTDDADTDFNSDVDGELMLHEVCVITGNERRYSTHLSAPQDCPQEIGKTLDALVSDFASWIYDRLEAEHDHLTSNETIDADIEAAEILFDEHGSTI